MRLLGYPNTGNVRTWQELRRYTSNFFALIPPILNGNITFKDNIKSEGPYPVVITTAAPIVAINHRMGVVPQGILVIYQDAGVVLFAADPLVYPWTNAKIFLTASSAVNAQVILI